MTFDQEYIGKIFNIRYKLKANDIIRLKNKD